MAGNTPFKKAISILTTAIYLTTSTLLGIVGVFAAHPMVVWADIDVNNNNIGDVSNGQTVNINNARIEQNSGTVVTNSDSGAIITNESSGVISDNQGLVISNCGTVTVNNGNVPTDGYIISGETKGISSNLPNATVGTNNGYLRANSGTVTTNNGTIDKNIDGLVRGNHGLIKENSAGDIDSVLNGTAGVLTNASDGEIELNSGVVGGTIGIIDKNTGTVITVSDVGKVVLNNGYVSNLYGEVTNNFGDVISREGTVVNQYDGEVQVDSSYDITITNYYGGTLVSDTSNITVTNNFADVPTAPTATMTEATINAITADGVNQYRSVSFVAAENSNVSYGDDFTEKTLMNSDGTDGDTKYYINVTGGDGAGTITIVAEEGYKVVLNGAAEGEKATETYAFTYTLVPTNGGYKLNITGYNGNSCELSADMFGLVMQAIRQVNPNPGPASDPTETGIAVDASNIASTAEETAIASTDVIIDAQRAADTINATPAGGTAQIAITSNKLDADLVRLLLARRDINVNLACFVNGKLCLIIIPAGADLSELIEADGSISIARLAEVFGTVEV